jgi:hypothetical protein
LVEGLVSTTPSVYCNKSKLPKKTYIGARNRKTEVLLDGHTNTHTHVDGHPHPPSPHLDPSSATVSPPHTPTYLLAYANPPQAPQLYLTYIYIDPSELSSVPHHTAPTCLYPPDPNPTPYLPSPCPAAPSPTPCPATLALSHAFLPHVLMPPLHPKIS